MNSNLSFEWPIKPSGVFAVIWQDGSSARLDLNGLSGSYCSSSGGRWDADPRYVKALAPIVASGEAAAVRAWLEANPNPSRPPQAAGGANGEREDSASEPQSVLEPVPQSETTETGEDDKPKRSTIAAKLYNLGYKDLVFVIPPGAELSPNSRIDPGSRGKVPGRLGPSGWHGYAWDNPADRAMAEEIDRIGANLGLRAERFPGLDLDVEDPDLARVLVDLARQVLGPAPARLSREPRRLLMYRTKEPFSKRAAVIQYKGQSHTVEALGDGQQYLISGRHPSGARYRWESFETNPENLTPITEAKVEAFFETLKERLEAKGLSVELTGLAQKPGPAEAVPDDITEGSRNTTLASIAGTFRRRHIPQDAALEALKGMNRDRCSPPLDDDEVEQIVESIYSNYPPGPDPIVRPPEEVFTPVPEAMEKPTPNKGKPAISVWTPEQLRQRPRPEYRWLVDGMLPPDQSCALVAKPKVGKSTLARALAVAVAQGTEWLGASCVQGPVIYVKFPNEGKWVEFDEEIRRLGIRDEDPLYLVDVERFEDRKTVLSYLEGLYRDVNPVLVIVDTFQGLAQIDDLNDYVKVHKALQLMAPYSKDALVLYLHHDKKGQSDMADAGIGSIAFFGAHEVNYRLVRDGSEQRIRYLQAQGRGVEMEPQVIDIDGDTHEPYLRGPRSERRLQTLATELLAALAEGPVLQRELIGHQGKRDPRFKALHRLRAQGRVDRDGSGARGDPYRWHLIEAADVFAPVAAPEPAAKQAPFWEESGNSPPDDEATDLSDEAEKEGSDA